MKKSAKKDKSSKASPLTHLNEKGEARLVDVSGKPATDRSATAEGTLTMNEETAELISSGSAKKGDVLAVARVAAIMAAKRTSEIVPLCHPIALSHISVDFKVSETAVTCRATVRTTGPTGVEMEALTAVHVGLLTVYDMLKATDRGMTAGNIRLIEKSGGKSGDFRRD